MATPFGPVAAGNLDEGAPVEVLIRPEGLGRTTLTVLANFSYGPEILFHTPHSVVATPYPRNAAGQIDAYRIYSAVDPDAARRLAEKRGIDIIVTCRDHEIYSGLSGAPDTLESRLRRGEASDRYSQYQNRFHDTKHDPLSCYPDSRRHAWGTEVPRMVLRTHFI